MAVRNWTVSSTKLVKSTVCGVTSGFSVTLHHFVYDFKLTWFPGRPKHCSPFCHGSVCIVYINQSIS